MRGQVEWGLMFVLLIIIGIWLLAMALPIILRAMGMTEFGNLLDKLQNLQKYKDEGVSVSLPTYVSSVNFFQGVNEACVHPLCRSLCTEKASGEPCKGNGFITVNLDSSSKPTTLSVLWKFATFRFDKAKAEAVQMAISDTCIPRDFFIVFGGTPEPTKYIQTDGKHATLVLEGSVDKVKSYCIRPRETKNGLEINIVKEDAC